MKTSPLPPLAPVQIPLSRIPRISRFLPLACLLLSGCTVLTYKSETGEHFTRTSFGSKTSIAHLSVASRTNGVHKVDLRGYKDDNTEAMGAITEAAIKAALTAAKP